VEFADLDLKELLEGNCCLAMEAPSPGIEVSAVSSRLAPEMGFRIVMPARCIATISVVIIGAATTRSARVLPKRLDAGASFAESKERTEELILVRREQLYSQVQHRETSICIAT
jgi:hypothetical protein